MPRYELLNFGVPGYQPPQQLVALENALSFSPNAVFYVATGREISRAASYLVEVVQKNVEIPYEPLRDVVNRAGLLPSMDEATALKRLGPFRDTILSWTYKRIADEVRGRGVLPVFVFLPQVREGEWQDETPEILRIAERAGFTVIDLSGVYRGQDIAALRLAEWDEHPNQLGHQLIASLLFDELQKQPSTIGDTQEQAPAN